MGKALETTCHTCRHGRMCYIFRETLQLVRFDTNHRDYETDFAKFFKTLAEVCEEYKAEE
jgi:hypothetical protein